jgi:tetratricopeptide (TPR) repeat protein
MQVRILSAVIAPLLAGAITLPSVAQGPLNLPTDPAGIVALQARQQKEEAEMRKVLVSKEPGGNLDALPAFIRQHPAFSADKGAVFNYAYSFKSYLQKGHPDPKTLDQKMHAIQEALQQTVPAYYQGLFDFEMARLFLRQDGNPAEAKILAESAVALYSQSDCLQDDRFSAESRHIGDEKRAKQPVPFTYHIEDGEMHCGKENASRYATLGKTQVKLGETDAAVDNFQKALHVYSSTEAALGLATIDKAKGDKSAALDMLTEAYLTGDMPAEKILEAKALYGELHPGSTPTDYEALLDQRYAKTFVNPVKYVATPSRHVVLDELFTGAGCEPCIAPDLATDAALHRYASDQVVFAIYHNNAPVSDPLTNNTSVARAKYYGTGGSTPHVFLDGKEIELEEGQPSHAQSAFDLLTKAIDPLFAAPSKAILNLAAHREGNLVEVTVSGKTGDLPAKTHLQILLLETEVSYSGENTLHFQPMVVRAGAGLKDEDTGLIITPSVPLSQHYTFDLKKIEADNFAYYDQSRQEMEKRLASLISSGRMSKAEIDKMAEFREPKNLIHPDRLAVVAFLQADDSKQVLQTTYATVSGGEAGEAK